jgi:hypothetical protein
MVAGIPGDEQQKVKVMLMGFLDKTDVPAGAGPAGSGKSTAPERDG